jgi:hypothetical protein
VATGRLRLRQGGVETLEMHRPQLPELESTDPGDDELLDGIAVAGQGGRLHRPGLRDGTGGSRPMGRRGAGEGSVCYLEDRGLWAGAVNLAPMDGRRVRKVVKAKTKAQVLRKMRELQGQIDQGLPVPDNTTTTAEWLRWWLSDVLPGTVKGGTVTNYRDVIDAYVIPHVGTVPLAKLGARARPGHDEAPRARRSLSSDREPGPHCPAALAR